jgi:hypothetical protein
MMFLPLFLLAGSLSPGPAPTAASADLVAELEAACRVDRGDLSDIAVVDYAGMLADSSERLRRFCPRRDRGLALRLAKAVAEAPSPASGGAYSLLSVFYEGAHGMARDEGLSRTYRRRAWLLGSRLENPFKSPEEAAAYLTAPETLAFLRERLARGARAKERVWLAEALLARRAAGDVAEARQVLKTPEAATEPAARLILANLALEPGADPADVADAAARLRPVAPSPGAGREARPLILRLARLQLAAAKTPEEKWDSVQSLAAAAYAGEAEALQAFREALRAANGGAEPATLDAAAPPPRIVADDYPALAMRQNLAGQVRLRALVDPRGRIIFTEAAGPAQPASLVDTVRRVYASRTVSPVAIPGPHPTPYVWVSVPPVNFRISD